MKKGKFGFNVFYSYISFSLKVAKSQKVFSSHFHKNEGNHFYFNVNKKDDMTLILFFEGLEIASDI